MRGVVGNPRLYVSPPPLQMRRDLLHWDAALQLARSLQASEVPFISREFAFELECIGDYVNALMNFERALDKPPCSQKHQALGDSDLGWAYDEEASDVVLKSRGASGDCCLVEGVWEEHLDLCQAGIARTALRLGDYKRYTQFPLFVVLYMG